MEYKDYYKILGVDKKAGKDEIRKAYRKLAKKYHPDANQGDESKEARFKEIQEAYEVLGDEEKRRKYDSFGSDFASRGSHEFDPRQYGFEDVSYGFTDDGFSDFFNMFFGDSFGQRRSWQSSGRQGGLRGSDVEAVLSVSIEEAHNGAKKSFVLSGRESKTITVTIPKGIMPGEKIRLKGKGEQGFGQGETGDLLLKVELMPTRKMTMDGHDIYSTVDVYPWEAYLGTVKKVKTLDGLVDVTIPKGIQGGKRIRLKNKGYLDRKGHGGHMYVDVNIINPVSYDAGLEEHYKALAEKYKS